MLRAGLGIPRTGEYRRAWTDEKSRGSPHKVETWQGFLRPKNWVASTEARPSQHRSVLGTLGRPYAFLGFQGTHPRNDVHLILCQRIGLSILHFLGEMVRPCHLMNGQDSRLL